MGRSWLQTISAQVWLPDVPVKLAASTHISIRSYVDISTENGRHLNFNDIHSRHGCWENMSSRKSGHGRQTSKGKPEVEPPPQEEASPYDGLIGNFKSDYPMVCERNGITAFPVEIGLGGSKEAIRLMQDEEDSSTLSEIHIENLDVTIKQIEAMQVALEMIPSHLENFKLINITFDQTTLKGLLNLATKKNLKKLSLDFSCLPVDLSPLFGVSSIHHISLKSCSLTDEHCCSIGRGLAANEDLVGLSLACNKIGDKGMLEIVKGLRLNRALLLLSLTNNYIGDTAAVAIAEALTEFELTHEEVVQRRRLLAAGGTPKVEEEAMEHDTSANMSRQSSAFSHSPDKLGRGSTKGKPPPGKKDSGKKEDKGKKDDKGKRGSIDKKIKGKEKGKKGLQEQALETPPPLEVPKIVNPLLEHVTDGKGVLRMTGNLALASLSLAYNHITDKGLKALLEAMEKQQTIQDRGQGLLRLSVKNSHISSDSLSVLNELVAARDPLVKKEEEIPIPE